MASTIASLALTLSLPFASFDLSLFSFHGGEGEKKQRVFVVLTLLQSREKK